MHLVSVLVEAPPGKVVARLGGNGTVPGIFPLATAKVQNASGVVSDALLHLKRSRQAFYNTSADVTHNEV